MPSEHEKYYKILDLDVEASKEEVQNAFKELSLIWHPDNHSDKSPEVQSRSTEKFKELSNAYEVLTKYLSEEDSSNEAEEKKSKETEKPRRDAVERKNPRRPWIGGGLSLLSLGLGHIYGGELKRGVLFFLFLQFGWVGFLSIPNSNLSFVLFLTLLLFWLIGIVDAVKICRKKKWYEPKIYNTWIIFFSIITITLLFLDPIKKDMGIRAFKISGMGNHSSTFEGDHVLTKMYSYGFRFPIKIPFANISLFPDTVLFPREAKRGDIVIFKRPTNGKSSVGRVVGLPQELLEIVNEKVYINNILLNEDYKHIDLSRDMHNDFVPIVIPAGHVFILLDNRRNSSDSRHYGFVAMDKIMGKVFKIYWSWDKEKNWIRSSRIGTGFETNYEMKKQIKALNFEPERIEEKYMDEILKELDS